MFRLPLTGPRQVFVVSARQGKRHVYEEGYREEETDCPCRENNEQDPTLVIPRTEEQRVDPADWGVWDPYSFKDWGKTILK